MSCHHCLTAIPPAEPLLPMLISPAAQLSLSLSCLHFPPAFLLFAHLLPELTPVLAPTLSPSASAAPPHRAASRSPGHSSEPRPSPTPPRHSLHPEEQFPSVDLGSYQREAMRSASSSAPAEGTSIDAGDPPADSSLCERPLGSLSLILPHFWSLALSRSLPTKTSTRHRRLPPTAQLRSPRPPPSTPVSSPRPAADRRRALGLVRF